MSCFVSCVLQDAEGLWKQGSYRKRWEHGQGQHRATKGFALREKRTQNSKLAVAVAATQRRFEWDSTKEKRGDQKERPLKTYARATPAPSSVMWRPKEKAAPEHRPKGDKHYRR